MISVIICTYNRADLLGDVLQTVCMQTLDRAAYEVIVVDNHSTDETAVVTQAFAAQHPHVRYVMEPQQGLSHARNRGWQEAKGEYVAYLDDDCKTPTGWLTAANAVIEELAPDVFGGPYFAFYKTPKPAWFKDEYGSHAPYEKATFLATTPDALHGGNLFLRHACLKQVGGFDPALGMVGSKLAYGEETALLRYIQTHIPTATFYYDPDLWVYHLVRPEKMSLRWQIQDRFAKGRYISRVYQHTQPQSSTWFGIILRMVAVGSLVVMNLFKGAFFRNRKKTPYFYNFLYDVVCPQITRLGRLYEQYQQATA